jgi:hypothetical protein
MLFPDIRMLKVHTLNLVLSVFSRWIGNQLDQIELQRMVRDSNKHTTQCLLFCYTVILSSQHVKYPSRNSAQVQHQGSPACDAKEKWIICNK